MKQPRRKMLTISRAVWAASIPLVPLAAVLLLVTPASWRVAVLLTLVGLLILLIGCLVLLSWQQGTDRKR